MTTTCCTACSPIVTLSSNALQMAMICVQLRLESCDRAPYHVESTASVADVLNVMEEHQVRRLPVIENHRLVGIVSEADIARHLAEVHYSSDPQHFSDHLAQVLG